MNVSASLPAHREVIEELHRLSGRILELVRRTTLQADLSCRADVVKVMKRLRDEVEQLSRSSSSSVQRGLTNWQLQRVTHHMTERLDQPLPLDELAGLLKLSRWHFCTSFRLASGSTPREWLIDQRVQRAQHLLTQTQLSITEIALAVGYRSSSAFAAQFRRNVGVTPTHFRRR